MFLFCSRDREARHAAPQPRRRWRFPPWLALPLRQGTASIWSPGDTTASDPADHRLSAQGLERWFPWRERKGVLSADQREPSRWRIDGAFIDAANASVA